MKLDHVLPMFPLQVVNAVDHSLWQPVDMWYDLRNKELGGGVKNNSLEFLGGKLQLRLTQYTKFAKMF